MLSQIILVAWTPSRDLLIEAVGLRRCPGITFADGPNERRAKIAGTGIDIRELIAAFKGLGENYDRPGVIVSDKR